MQTCTNCGTSFEGYACPNCGTAAGQGYQQSPPAYNQQPAYTPRQDPYQQQPAYAPPIQQGQYQPQGQYPPPPGAAPVYAPIPPAVQKKPGPSKALIVILVVIAVVIASIAMAVMFISVTNPFNDAREVFNGDLVTGTMSGDGTDNLYKIALNPGEVLSVTLSGAAGTDFDLYAYENVLFWDEYIITGSASESSTEAMTFVAWESTSYILDVYSYQGSGDYTMNVDIVDTVSLDDGDNSISSAYPLDSGNTVSDDLNEYYDQDDYYSIYLNQGEILHAFLEVPVQVSTDFDLYIYDSSGNQLDVSELAYGNEELYVYAETSGYYYVNVWAYDGIGIYSLSVEVTQAPGADSNNSPGTAEAIASGSTISSTLSQYSDADDYYSIDLSAGDTITATLNGPTNADFDLYIWNNGPQLVAGSEEIGSYETVSYTSPITGRYYVNPYAYSGYGSYTLSVTLGSASTLTANAGYDRTVGTGQSIDFDGTGSSGPITSYSWDFGDGSTGSGTTASHSYSTPGTYTATLTVSDGSSSSTDSITITVEDASSMPNKYAVVVGISDYQGDGDLNFCDEDANSWTSYLQSQGYTVHTLIDSQGSRDGIMDEINWLGAQEQAGDYVAFIFSGHGSYSDRTRSSYICAWNVEEPEGFISDADLGAAFANFDSDHIFIFFDSCHSGGMDSVAGPGRYVTQTAGQLEYGLDAPKHEHGMWVYWYLEYAIEGQGNLDMTQAFDVAYPNAVNDAAEGGNSMHPEQEYSGTSFYL